MTASRNTYNWGMNVSTISPTFTMTALSELTAISPLDGRYAKKLANLRPLMSEFGYMQRRVQVEITWFVAQAGAHGFQTVVYFAQLAVYPHLATLFVGATCPSGF